MAPRGKRKFYPEFYTEDELVQMENTSNANADEAAATGDVQEERTVKTATEEIEVKAEVIEKTEKHELNEVNEKIETESEAISQTPSDAPLQPVRKSNGGNTSTAKRKPAAKKVELKEIDKPVPDDIKEKLYGRAGDKTDAVRKRLDALEKDYGTQKIAIASAEAPVQPNQADQSNQYEEPEESETPEMMADEYKDYPFDDEPYKMMDLAAMVMSGSNMPYNDAPYENDEAEYPNYSVEDIPEEEAVEVVEQAQQELAVQSDQYAEEHPKSESAKSKGSSHDITSFDVENAIKYARRWALDRNPEYLDFDELGGDCTNYVSQILSAGGCPMDKTPIFGWYYIDGSDKSPSWTGVEQLYKYLLKEKEYGIVAREIGLNEVEAGDIVQLSFNGKTFQHTPFIVSVTRNTDHSVSYDRIKICAHSFDSENRPLDTYKWRNIRFIRILGYTL